MTLKSLQLIWHVTLGIFVQSMTVQSRHIIKKRDSTPCTPQIKNSTKSFLSQLDETLNNLKYKKKNTVGNLDVSCNWHFVAVE